MIRQLLLALGLVSQIGLMMAISIGGGWLVGSFLDARFQTGFTLSVVGLIFGVIGGFIVVYRLMMRTIKKLEG